MKLCVFYKDHGPVFFRFRMTMVYGEFSFSGVQRHRLSAYGYLPHGQDLQAFPSSDGQSFQIIQQDMGVRAGYSHAIRVQLQFLQLLHSERPLLVQQNMFFAYK